MIRRLESRQETESKRKRNQLIVGAVLIFIMIGSTLGFVLQFGGHLGGNPGNQGTGSGTLNHNGFEFTNVNGLWVLGQFVFRYSPNEVPNVPVEPDEGGLKPSQSYQGTPVYLYTENDEAGSEIIVNMGQIATRVQEACPEGEQCLDSNLPVKSCTDNFIIIKEANSSSITQQDNCVFIEGTQSQLTRLADQFLYKILGVK